MRISSLLVALAFVCGSTALSPPYFKWSETYELLDPHKEIAPTMPTADETERIGLVANLAFNMVYHRDKIAQRFGEMKDMFSKFDEMKTGVVDPDKFIETVRRIFPEAPHAAVIHLAKMYDIEHDQKCYYRKFLGEIQASIHSQLAGQLISAGEPSSKAFNPFPADQ